MLTKANLGTTVGHCRSEDVVILGFLLPFKIWGLKMGCLEAGIEVPEMATLLAQACSALVQASLPLAQVKAAVPQVGDRNWNSEEKNTMLDYRGSDANRFLEVVMQTAFLFTDFQVASIHMTAMIQPVPMYNSSLYEGFCRKNMLDRWCEFEPWFPPQLNLFCKAAPMGPP